MRITAGTTPSVDLTDRITRLLGVTRDASLRALLAAEGMSARFIQAGVAAQFTRLQLSNPAASGKTLICTQIIVVPGATVTVRVISVGAALANLGPNGINDVVGGAAGVGVIRSDTVGVLAGNPRALLTPAINAATFFPTVPAPLYVIPQGQDITLIETTGNVQLDASFKWLEVDPVTFL